MNTIKQHKQTKERLSGKSFFVAACRSFFLFGSFGTLIAQNLTSIVITPSNPTMSVNQTLTFTAQGYDANGDPFQINDPQWSANHQYGTQTIDPDNPYQCYFTATHIGTGGIACGEGGFDDVVGSTDIYIVQSNQLASIEVDPGNATLSVGENQLFTATGYNDGNNPVPITPVWTTTGGTITSVGLYTATVAGDFMVTASVSGSPVTGTGNVHVDPVTSVDGGSEIPTGFQLYQNHPNPFNSETKIRFSLPSNQRVVLTVYDMNGKKTATITDNEFSGGVHSVQFDGSNLTSGIYFYKIAAGNFIHYKKLILLR